MSCTVTKDLEVGTTARLKANLKLEKAFSDVAIIKLIIKDPKGLSTQPQVVRDDQGRWHADVQVRLPGQYRFRWETIGPTAAEEGSFVVRKSQVI